MTGRGAFVIVAAGAYALLFVWQLLVGSMVGKEAGFLLYAVLAFPVVIAGFPWWSFLSSWMSYDGHPLDLTTLSLRTVSYHAMVLVSFAINLLLMVMLARFLRKRRDPLPPIHGQSPDSGSP